jgi:hypothetical protein
MEKFSLPLRVFKRATAAVALVDLILIPFQISCAAGNFKFAMATAYRIRLARSYPVNLPSAKLIDFKHYCF